MKNVVATVIAVVSILTSHNVHAQCPNDNVFYMDLTPAGAGSTASDGCIYGGEYVTVNVVSGQTYNFNTCGSFYDTQLTLINSGTGLSVGYNDDGCGLQSTVTWLATFTGTLWVLVDYYPCSNLGLCMNISVTQIGAAPANDACAGALPITCGQTITGSTASATPDAVPAGCGNGTSNSLWYSFVGTGQLVTMSLCGSTYDTQLSVMTGSCGALSCVAYNDDDPNFVCGLQSWVMFDAQLGVTYYVRVSGFGTNSGNFTLSANPCINQTANDACSGAFPISCGQSVSGTTIGFNIDDIPNGCGFEFSPGVWYQTTGTGEMFTLDLCGSDFDTQLSVFTGSCTSLACVETNDDGLSCGTSSEVTFATQNGTVYYIYVFGLPPSEGNYTLNMTCSPYVPSPQDCSGAVSVCSDTQFNGNSMGSGDFEDLNASNQGCLASGENQSSWYVFSPLTTGTISFTINPTPIVDYDFAIWGPFPTVPCPITTAPLRCSFSAAWSATGLGNGAVDLTENAGGDAWVAPITVGAAQLNQIYIMCLDNFSSTTTPFVFDWALSGVTLDCTIQMPIELGDIQVAEAGHANKIYWSTITEWMNERFVVEKSYDNHSYFTIGIVPGALFSQHVMNYDFLDENPGAQTTYYRIRQEDTNGQFSYTPVVSITRSAVYDIYPNPANDQITITTTGKSDASSFCLFNTSGAKVKCLNLSSFEKMNIRTDVSDLVPGLYHAVIFSSTGQKIYDVKLVIE